METLDAIFKRKSVIEFLDKDDFDVKKIKTSLDENFSKIETLIAVNGGVKNELQ